MAAWETLPSGEPGLWGAKAYRVAKATPSDASSNPTSRSLEIPTPALMRSKPLIASLEEATAPFDGVEGGGSRRVPVVRDLSIRG
jgi:hypothetical protein